MKVFAAHKVVEWLRIGATALFVAAVAWLLIVVLYFAIS